MPGPGGLSQYDSGGMLRGMLHGMLRGYASQHFRPETELNKPSRESWTLCISSCKPGWGASGSERGLLASLKLQHLA